MIQVIPPSVEPRNLAFAFSRQPRGTPGKDYNIRIALQLDAQDYKLLISDITQLSIASGLDMKKSLRTQNTRQVAVVRRKTLDLYPGMGIFETYAWPIDMLLGLALKISSDKAGRVIYKARRAEHKLAVLWAKVRVALLSRFIPPPVLPVVFDLAHMPSDLAKFLPEVLVGHPLALWPVVSLAALSCLSALPRSPPLLICTPRFSLLLPLRHGQSRVVTVNIIPPNCSFLTRKRWTLRMTVLMAVEGEVIVQGKEAGASRSCLVIVRAVPLWCELIDELTDSGLAGLE
ncbi:hypothetical protein FS749_006183 [Ceratobasidium sp. UAMH 11750]|nr:hypothetical protein FS749_006183 [Ceratobasidium sp. UAMH 11750]